MSSSRLSLCGFDDVSPPLMESTAVGGKLTRSLVRWGPIFFFVAPPLFVVLANRIPLAAKDETRMDWAATSAAISKKEGVAGGRESGGWTAEEQFEPCSAISSVGGRI